MTTGCVHEVIDIAEKVRSTGLGAKSQGFNGLLHHMVQLNDP